jgi:hypothetical protein
MSLRFCVLAVVVAAAAPARANPYEAFIDVETEDDLVDLLAARQITEETYETLLALLNRGVDLERANREELYSLPNLTYPEVDAILAFRKEEGFIGDPAKLVASGVLSEDKLLAISAFLILTDELRSPYQPHGWVRAITRAAIADSQVPPIGIRARVTSGKDLTAGLVATMTRLRLGDVVYDPNRDALLADPEGVQFHVPKAYLRYETDNLVAIAGTYRAGFGQRLVFDNSSDYTPNGIYLDDQLFYDSELSKECKQSITGAEAPPTCDADRLDTYVTPDFGWREALMGIAAGAKHIDLGPGYVQAYGWASYQPRSIYQYELVDGARCVDPRDDDDPACAAPGVNRRPDGGILDPASRYSFQTLPNVFGEAVAGANVAYFADRRNYIGATGYGANETVLVDGIELDTQEWSRIPNGGRFGAAGANFAVGRQWLDVFGEAAYSFDRMEDGLGPSDGGGGPAVTLRATATQKKRELELSLRYFDVDFVNPFARPIAAADEFEGQRARDEAGGRARYTGKHGPLALRTAVDFWVNPSESSPKVNAYVRTDIDATDAVRWGVWVEFDDKDLRAGGRDECFEVSVEEDERGEPIPCKGMKLTTIGRLRVELDKRTSLTGQLQHEILDEGSMQYTDKFRQDLSAWVIGLHRPAPRVRLRGRLRYLSEAIDQKDYLETSLWAYADATFGLRKKDSLRIRGDVYVYLDDRDSSMTRKPSPEIWAWLEYIAKF